MNTNADKYANFWKRLIPSPGSSCLLWSGSVGDDGYGKVMVNWKHWRAHRLAYTLAIGPIPRDEMILHSCDNPLCCNPEHLRAGTARENMWDCVFRRRNGEQKKTSCPAGHPYDKENTRIDTDGARRCRTCWKKQAKERYYRTYIKRGLARGERVGAAKMTAKKVISLRADRANGLTYQQLEAKYGIEKTQARRIVDRIAWAHI